MVDLSSLAYQLRYYSGGKGATDFARRVADEVVTILSRKHATFREAHFLVARVHASTENYVQELLALPMPTEIPKSLAREIHRRNWKQAREVASPEHYPTLVVEVVLATPDPNLWPGVLALFLRDAEKVHVEHRRLSMIFALLRSLELRMFDSERAAATYATLPETITVFRGTPDWEMESASYGFSWSLNRHEARRFARRNLVAWDATHLLRARISRSHVVGVLLGRSEYEVIVAPEKLTDVRIDERLSRESELERLGAME